MLYQIRSPNQIRQPPPDMPTPQRAATAVAAAEAALAGARGRSQPAAAVAARVLERCLRPLLMLTAPPLLHANAWDAVAADAAAAAAAGAADCDGGWHLQRCWCSRSRCWSPHAHAAAAAAHVGGPCCGGEGAACGAAAAAAAACSHARAHAHALHLLRHARCLHPSTCGAADHTEPLPGQLQTAAAAPLW